MKQHFKDFLYYSFRAPTAFLGFFCLACAFGPDLDITTVTFFHYLTRIVIFFIGVYILYPNHLFKSDFWYKFRFYTMIILSILISILSLNMLFEYQPGKNDFTMVPVGFIIFWLSIANNSVVKKKKS